MLHDDLNAYSKYKYKTMLFCSLRTALKLQSCRLILNIQKSKKKMRKGFIGFESTTICWGKGWILNFIVVSQSQNRVFYCYQSAWVLYLEQEKSSLYWIRTPMSMEAYWRCFFIEKECQIKTIWVEWDTSIPVISVFG